MKYVQCDNVRRTPELLIFATSRTPFPDKPIEDPSLPPGVLPSNRPMSRFHCWVDHNELALDLKMGRFLLH